MHLLVDGVFLALPGALRWRPTCLPHRKEGRVLAYPGDPQVALEVAGGGPV